MNADDQIRPATRIAQLRQRLRLRVRGIAGRVLARTVRPYARHRARQAETVTALRRLQADFEHVRKRHTEQIERLEELVRELVLTAESLRRGDSRDADDGEDR
jgi:alanyl-tRNA synthetase